MLFDFLHNEQSQNKINNNNNNNYYYYLLIADSTARAPVTRRPQHTEENKHDTHEAKAKRLEE
jgi:hypothetical protein